MGLVLVPAWKSDRQKMETLYSTSDNLEPIKKNLKSEFNLSREAVFFLFPQYLHSESVKYLSLFLATNNKKVKQVYDE